MKFRNLVAALALGLMMCAAAVAQEKSPKGPPKLVIESFTHDFGEVKPGTALKYSFTFKNQGKSDLLIQGVTPG
ncbi:MAG TPA: DUF1573 domain-containing protein [Blastocatellia bacterium]|jgi:hypothetical protein|nr:DUF1573 domain-containing protein [Blastocatellia bacterium]